MIENIYKQLKKQSGLSFDEIYDLNKNETFLKRDLSPLLKELERQKKILFYKNHYYDLAPYPSIEGYAQWTMTGFCWLADTEKSNEYGITFNPEKDLVSIYNKKEAFYGSKVKAKDVVIDDHHFVYVTESVPTKPIKVIAVFNDQWNQWSVLNSDLNFSFQNIGAWGFLPHNSVSVFQTVDGGKSFALLEDFGHMKDFDIESKIIQEIALGVTLTKTKEPLDFISSESQFLKTDELSLNDVTLDKSFYTIDSIHTKDIDDAIFIEKDEDNNTVLYVAIADVSAYVPKDSKLDLSARNMASSYYLPQKTLHMVDKSLSEGFCSLHGGVPKKTMVCRMVFNDEGHMLHSAFTEETILSYGRLTYDDVDLILDDRQPVESKVYSRHKNEIVPLDLSKNAFPQEIKRSLDLLHEFSKTQGKTHRSYEWMFEFPEYKLGNDGKIDHLYIEDEEAPSQKMVTSAMLAANTATAKLLEESFPSLGLFRNQVAPIEGEKPTSALYSQNNEGHWGLGVDFYTHFTSPIRRYCDLVVHRLLKGVIHNKPSEYTNDELEAIALHINEKQYIAKQCESKAKQLLFPQYLEKLVMTHTFDEKLEIKDIKTSGLVCQNKQLIEIFVPSFKMDKELQKCVEEANERLAFNDTIAVRRKEIEKIYKNWMLFAKFQKCSWTDKTRDMFLSTPKRKVQRLTP